MFSIRSDTLIQCDILKTMTMTTQARVFWYFITDQSDKGAAGGLIWNLPPWSADRYPPLDGAWSPMSVCPALCAAIAHRFRLLMADLRIDNVNTQLSERNWIVSERDISIYIAVCVWMCMVRIRESERALRRCDTGPHTFAAALARALGSCLIM